MCMYSPMSDTFTPAAAPPSHAEGYATPKEMSEKDIEHIKTAFVDAAKRAVHAGFQVIELHMAHGYLLHEFLSPISNKR